MSSVCAPHSSRVRSVELKSSSAFPNSSRERNPFRRACGGLVLSRELSSTMTGTYPATQYRSESYTLPPLAQDVRKNIWLAVTLRLRKRRPTRKSRALTATYSTLLCSLTMRVSPSTKSEKESDQSAQGPAPDRLQHASTSVLCILAMGLPLLALSSMLICPYVQFRRD